MLSLRKRFGRKLRVLRLHRHCTQVQLGEKTGLDPRYLGAVERGEINITINNIEKIVRGLAVSPQTLFS